MLIITGTGRSGTSMLAGFCKLMGFDPGGGWSNNVNAGLEFLDVVIVNRAIDRGYADKRIRKKICSIDKLVIKDPRFIWKNVANYWLESRDDLTFIIMERDIEAVAESRFSEDNLLVHYKEQGTLISKEEFIVVKQKELEALKTLLDKREVEYKTLRFPDCLLDYRSVYKTLAGLGISFDYVLGKKKWEGWVDFSKVHY